MSELTRKEVVFILKSGKDFHRTDLSGLDLRGFDLSGANLSEANLAGAVINQASLRGANLAGADLRLANLDEADQTPSHPTRLEKYSEGRSLELNLRQCPETILAPWFFQ